MRKMTAAIGAGLALAGCGGGDGGGNAGDTGAGAAAGGWNATNACAILDKGVVAATLGSAVKSAELSAVKSEGGGAPLYSQCSYKLDDGRMLVFGTGAATNGASLADQVEDMRKQAAMVSNNKPVDLPNLGKAALWASDVHQLYAFLGDGRFVSATLSQLDFRKKSDPIEKIQADETAILKKAGA